MIDHTLTKKSIGKLRVVAHKTKPTITGYDMTGTLSLQRHTAAAILKALEDTPDDDVVCNIAHGP